MAGRLKNGSPLDKKAKVLKEKPVTKQVSKKKGVKSLFKKKSK